MARFAPRCARCDLDFGAFNVGDGPAAFLTLGIGTLVTVLAVWLELAVSPPFLVHMLLWLPLTIAAILWGLRVMKAGLLYVEWQRAAQEGRVAQARMARKGHVAQAGQGEPDPDAEQGGT